MNMCIQRFKVSLLTVCERDYTANFLASIRVFLTKFS